MAEGADQVAFVIQTHGVEVDRVRRVHLFICKIIRGWCCLCRDDIIKLRIVFALPFPNDFAVLHFL